LIFAIRESAASLIKSSLMVGIINAEQVILRLQALHRQQALVPFLGSGISAGPCRIWGAMVLHLAKRAKAPATGALIAAAESGDRNALTRLADAVAQRLCSVGKDTFIQQCADAVYQNSEQQVCPSGVKALASVGWPLVLTTNYDEFYLQALCDRDEAAASEHLKSAMLLGRGATDCRHIMHSLDLQISPIIWALQGMVPPVSEPVRKLYAAKSAELSEQIIVSDWQYQNAISEDANFRRSFAEVFRRRSLLFISYSLGDHYFSDLLARTVHEVGRTSLPHFALFAEHKQIDEEFLLSRLNVNVIRYADPQGDQSGLAAALQEIAEALSTNKLMHSAGHVSEVSYAANRERTLTLSLRPRQSQLPTSPLSNAPATPPAVPAKPLLSTHDIEHLLTTSSNMLEDIDFSTVSEGTGIAPHPVLKFIRLVQQIGKIYHPKFEKTLPPVRSQEQEVVATPGAEVPVLTVRVDSDGEAGTTGYGVPKLVPGFERRVLASDAADPIPVPTVRVEQSDRDFLPKLVPSMDHRIFGKAAAGDPNNAAPNPDIFETQPLPVLKLPGQHDSQQLPTLKMPNERDSQPMPTFRMPTESRQMPLLQMPEQQQTQPLAPIDPLADHDAFPASDPISVPTVRVEQDESSLPKLVAGFEHRVLSDQAKGRAEHSLPDLIVHLQDPEIVSLVIAGKIDVSELLLCPNIRFSAEAHYLSGAINQSTFIESPTTTIGSICECFSLDSDSQDWQIEVFPELKPHEKPLTVAEAFELSLEELAVIPNSRIVLTQRGKSGWLSKLAKTAGR
jgi:hypothetical protein